MRLCALRVRAHVRARAACVAHVRVFRLCVRSLVRALVLSARRARVSVCACEGGLPETIGPPPAPRPRVKSAFFYECYHSTDHFYHSTEHLYHTTDHFITQLTTFTTQPSTLSLNRPLYHSTEHFYPLNRIRVSRARVSYTDKVSQNSNLEHTEHTAQSITVLKPNATIAERHGQSFVAMRKHDGA